jgi:predicted metal-binding membrane protein
MSLPLSLSTPLTHRRATVTAVLLLLAALGWLGMAMMADDHSLPAGGIAGGVGGSVWDHICRVAMSPFAAPPPGSSWTVGQGLMALLMWLAMVLAMMLPTAAPMILTYGDLAQGPARRQGQAGPPLVFAAGYLAVWLGFSLVATAGQIGLAQASLLNSAAVVGSPWVAGPLLVAAGAYQFTPLKHLCLTACRNPMTWFMGHWRPGARGAWQMGLIHGLTCVGCCWALMLVMFVCGLMNLGAMAALGVVMLAEKVAPWGDRLGQAVGVGLMAWGAVILTSL